jgi:CTP synthase
MQLAAIEFARNVCGIKDATSREFEVNRKGARNFVIDFMEEQKMVKDKGGTMRLGSYPCLLSEESRVKEIYGAALIHERHRHRYEFNNKYRPLFQKKGMSLSGICEERDLVEIIELSKHPWFIGVQFHPEFKSRPLSPHPLFRSFVSASLSYRRSTRRQVTKQVTKKVAQAVIAQDPSEQKRSNQKPADRKQVNQKMQKLQQNRFNLHKSNKTVRGVRA